MDSQPLLIFPAVSPYLFLSAQRDPRGLWIVPIKVRGRAIGVVVATLLDGYHLVSLTVGVEHIGESQGHGPPDTAIGTLAGHGGDGGPLSSGLGEAGIGKQFGQTVLFGVERVFVEFILVEGVLVEFILVEGVTSRVFSSNSSCSGPVSMSPLLQRSASCGAICPLTF